MQNELRVPVNPGTFVCPGSGMLFLLPQPLNFVEPSTKARSILGICFPPCVAIFMNHHLWKSSGKALLRPENLHLFPTLINHVAIRPYIASEAWFQGSLLRMIKGNNRTITLEENPQFSFPLPRCLEIMGMLLTAIFKPYLHTYGRVQSVNYLIKGSEQQGWFLEQLFGRN